MGNIQRLTKNKKPQPRYLSEMQKVVKEPEEITEDKIIYDVYRNAANIDNLRYDLTFLYPNLLKDEFSKTYGHYHKNGMTEIMEVIKGQVWWLLQKYENDPKIITEAYLVEAKENDKVIFLPDFGVISINPTGQKTTLSNWLSLKMESDYEPYTKLRGACYYVCKRGKEIVFEKNKNYNEVPELIRLKPKETPDLGITFDKPLYDLIKTPEKLDFLNNPEKYKNILTIENCYSPR